MFKNLIAKFRTADIVWKFIYANIFVYIILVLIGVFFGAFKFAVAGGRRKITA